MDRNVYGGALYARTSCLKHKYGSDGMQNVLSEMKKLGYTGPTQLSEIRPKQKYPVRYLQQMNQAIINTYGEEKLWQIAQEAAKRKGIVGVFLKWAATLEMIMKRAPDHWPEFYDFGTMKTERTGNRYKLMLHNAYIDELFCKYLTNYYMGILKTANIKGEIIHTKCVGKGDKYCEWQISAGKQEKQQKIHTKKEIEEAETCGLYRPVEVRDAILHCLIEVEKDEENALIMLKEQFKQAGASWADPTKQDLQKIIGQLAQEALKTRDSRIIQNNHNKIQKMLKRCECREQQAQLSATPRESVPEPKQANKSRKMESPKSEHTHQEQNDQRCPYIKNCSIFNNQTKNNQSISFAKLWCTTNEMYPKCMRKQFKDIGREVPKTLLPNGEHIMD